MRTQPIDRARMKRAALQQIPCDLTIHNIRLVNVITGEIYPAEVDILDGLIVRVRTDGEQTATPSAAQFDGKGDYLIPGFIDAHMHVESTMMIPENLSRAIVPWGTTTVCTDPHEIGNVLGVPGVEFMLQNAKKSALRQYVLAPSCIPAAPGAESAGAAFGPAEVGQLLQHPEVIGVAELMDFVGVLSHSPRMAGIIEEGERQGAYLQGHAPTLKGKELTAYLLGGPISDHESATAAEVREKLRNGMHVNLRASSIADRVPALVEGTEGHLWRDFVSLCTDDVHARDLMGEGHINRVLKKVLACGVPPVEAVKLATLNTAREYHFEDLGAIAPGYVADLQLVQELDGGVPSAVFIKGALVAEQGRYVGPDTLEPLRDLPNAMQLDHIKSAEDFRLRAPAGAGATVTVNTLMPTTPGNFFKKLDPAELPVKDGFVDISGLEDCAYVCVCNRYGTGSVSVTVQRDLSLSGGAYATTISHDSHNLVVVYKNPQDAYLAVDRLRSAGGGVTAWLEGAELCTLELPVAGLMSTQPCAEVSAGVDRMEEAARKLYGPRASVLQASLLSLPCVPGFVVTDFGLVNGMTQQRAELFPG